MDTAGPIPSPSMAWSRVVSIGDPAADALSSTTPIPIRREDDAAQLKARLLRMIVSNEQTRKTAAGESKAR